MHKIAVKLINSLTLWLWIINCLTLVNGQVTYLDSPKLKATLRSTRTYLFDFIGRSGVGQRSFDWNQRNNVSMSMPFHRIIVTCFNYYS